MANGKLLGELLDKYGYQSDFGHFMKGETSEAKLLNFKRLAPTFRLLGIPFDANVAREVMLVREKIKDTPEPRSWRVCVCVCVCVCV